MAEGSGDVRDGRLSDLLDRCVSALRQGDSLEGCLNRISAADAARVRPLLEAYLELEARRVTPPTARLAAGKARFLATVTAAAREASDAVAAEAAPGNGRGPLTSALDEVLAAVAAGRPMEEALAPWGAMAATLRPLVEAFTEVEADAVPPPPAEAARAKRRLFVAVAAARAARAAEDPAAAAALDAALASGTAPRDAELAGLVAVASLVTDEAVAVPEAPDALRGGRARLLDAARGAPVAEPAASPLPIGSSWLAGLQSRWRVAATAVAVLLALLVGNAFVLQPVAASALPGEALYPVKRLSERVSLAMTLSPAEKARLRGELSRRRANELAALVAKGDTGAAVEWDALFLKARALDDEASDRGELMVSTISPEKTAPVTTTLAWNDDTRLDLGDDLKSLTDLARGSELRLWVRSRGDERLPLLVRARLLALATPDPTPTMVLRTPEPATVTPETPTETAAPLPTDAPPTFTATPPPSPTTAPTPTASPAANTGLTPEASIDLMDGVLLSDPAKATWLVLADNGQVSVNAARILEKEPPSGLASGDYVSFDGRWDDDAHTRFTARRLRAHGAAECKEAEQTGTVQSFVEGQSLTLANGMTFNIVADAPPEIVNGPVATGQQVRVVYGDCGGRRYVLRRVEVGAPADIKHFQGKIRRIDPPDNDGNARLVVTETVGIGADPVFVIFRPGETPITGELAVGAIVDVLGTLNEDETITATSIDVLVPAPPLAAPTLVPPTPTLELAPVAPAIGGGATPANP